MAKVYLLAAFCVLQVLDVATTNTVLAHGGFEGNPVMAHTMEHFGSLWPFHKLVMLAACLPIMLRWPAWKVAPFVALMGLVVANNLLWAVT
jgi:hypothetical protein